MKEIQKCAAGILAALTLVALNVSQAQTTNFIYDTFNPTGNPIGISGTNDYSAGQITNVWKSWFGSALQSVQWDSTQDASNNAGSGSMKITAAFSPTDSQFLVFNGFGAFTPALNGLQWTNFQCDVRFDPSSPTSLNGGATNFGHLQFCIDNGAASSYGQDYFAGVDAEIHTYTNWTHLSFPINAVVDSYLTNIATLGIHIYGPYYTPNLNGTTVLWVDNIQFLGRTNLTTTERPVIKPLQKAFHALRFLAGDTSLTYMRENIATVSTYASWYGSGSFPYNYSTTITNFPSITAQGFEYHMFLVPTAYVADPANTFVDWNTANDIALRISANTTNFVGALAYKVNLPGANENLPLATIASSTVIGTWTVRFNDDISGTLIFGTNSVNFTIPSADAATFANPMIAYFGVQPQSTNNYWQAADVSRIQISGISVDDDFASPGAFGLDTGTWNIVASIPACIWETDPAAKYWLNWTVPEDVYTPVVSTNLNLSSAWVDPAVYNANTPVKTALIGAQRWALLQTNNLPPGAKNVFLAVRKPATP
jgi:hypothetical protein